MIHNELRLIQEGLQKGMSYSDYIFLMNDLVATGKSTGEEQSEQRANYTKLNASRMRRIDKTVSIPEAKLRLFRNISERQVWLVLLESWCSDGAQTIPILNKIAQATSKIDLKIILRDDNSELMDCFLTNGTRSIPKLLITDEEGALLHVWGPRSKVATKLVEDYKKYKGKIDEEFKKNLQFWYTRDGGKEILNDIVGFALNTGETTPYH